MIEARTSAQDPRSLSGKLYRTLLDIQYGRVPDHPWSVPFDPAVESHLGLEAYR